MEQLAGVSEGTGNRYLKLTAEVLDESVDEAVRLLVAPMNQRVMAVNHSHLPNGRARTADVGHEVPRVRPVQISNGGGQHYDVTRRLVCLKNNSLGHWAS